MTVMRVQATSDELVTLYEDGHRYVVGEGLTEREPPSFSRMLASAGLSTDYSAVDPTHLQFRSEVGSLVHLAIEMNLKGFSVDLWSLSTSLLAVAAQPHYEAFLRWADKHTLVTFLAEAPAYNPALKYCTTEDWIGLLDGEPWVIDFKTTYKVLDTVRYKTMAQKLCFDFFDEEDQEDQYMISDDDVRRGALHLPKRGIAKLVPFKNDDADRTVVAAASVCWYAKDRS